MPKSIILSTIAWFYKATVNVRHTLFDRGLIKSNKFDIPIICIGNITVGGTGKTPMTELVISHMSSKFNVAVLSRGYGRRTKGYLEVSTQSHYRDVGDEPLQIKLKFPEVKVIVCEKRIEGIKRIQAEHPEIDLIVMDDGFQHRQVEAKINIVTIDATRPIKEDKMLPLGSLRDVESSLTRAHYFIVTKCPETMQPIDRRLWRKTLISYAYQSLYFTRYVDYRPEPLFSEDAISIPALGSKVIAVSGLGNPRPFTSSLSKSYELVGEIRFKDHHVYKIRDIKRMTTMLEEHPEAVILLTEKDAVKLRVPEKLPQQLRERIFYIPMHINFIDEPSINFLNKLEQDVREN